MEWSQQFISSTSPGSSPVPRDQVYLLVQNCAPNTDSGPSRQMNAYYLLVFSVTMWETTANFRKSFSFVPHFFPQKWICFFQTFTPLWLISEMRHCNWNSSFFHDSTRSISLWIGLRVVKLPTSRRLGERPRFRSHIVFWYQLIQRPCP